MRRFRAVLFLSLLIVLLNSGSFVLARFHTARAASLDAVQTCGALADKTKFIGLRGFASVANFVVPVNSPAASAPVSTGVTDATRGDSTCSCR